MATTKKTSTKTAPAKANSKVTFTMSQKKSTKGTVVFANEEAPVTQLYVSRDFVDDSVDEITVTLEK